MTLPPPAPAYQRAVFALVLLGVLIAAGAIAGTLPLLRKWLAQQSEAARK